MKFLLALLISLVLSSPILAAPATKLLYQSGAEGASVFINYDDSTLVATSITFTNGLHAAGPLIFYFIIGGVITTVQTSVGTAVKTYTFPTPLTGTLVTDKHGGSDIDWGLSIVGAGTNIIAPSAVQ